MRSPCDWFSQAVKPHSIYGSEDLAVKHGSNSMGVCSLVLRTSSNSQPQNRLAYLKKMKLELTHEEATLVYESICLREFELNKIRVWFAQQAQNELSDNTGDLLTRVTNLKFKILSQSKGSRPI